MSMRDEDFGAALTAVEAEDGLWSPPMAAPARAEELRRAEMDARSRAGSLKSQLDKNRNKLKAAVEETKEVRRAAKNALFYQAEVARLEKLLSQAGVESSKRSTIMSLRMEVFRLREALQASQARKDTTAPSSGEKDKPPKAAPTPKTGKDTVGPLSRENARLRKALERSQEQKDELVALRRKVAALRRSKRAAQASPPRASARLRRALERTRKQKDTIKALRGEVGSLNRETRRLNRENGRLRRELEPLQGLKKAVRRLSGEAKLLRGELAGYHDQMDLIALLTRRRRLSGNCPEEVRHREGGGGGRACRSSPAARGLQEIARPGQDHRVAAQGERTAGQKDQGCCGLGTREWKPGLPSFVRPGPCCRRRSTAARARSRTRRARSASEASNAALPGTAAPSGRRSRRRRNGTIRRRTRASVPVAGSPMSPMASFPRPSSRSRSRPTSAESSRPRHRRGCDCASSPLEVAAPPVPRLFPRTPYGTTVWARILFERFACFRPLRRVAAWMADQGLAIAPGTVAGSVPRFLPLFEPLAKAILAHQNEMAVRHGDETGWRIQSLSETGRSRRAWLWISVSADAVYFLIDPSRSAEVAMKLFGSVKGIGVPGLRPIRRLRKDGARARRQGDSVLVLGAPAARLHRVCGRPGEADGMVPGMDRADRVGLPAERGAAGALRPRARTPDAGVRRGAERAEEGGRRPVRARRSGSLPPVCRSKAREGQGAALAAQASRGAERLCRQATGAHGQQRRGARTARRGNRASIELRFRQRQGRRLHGDHVLRGEHPLDARHRRPALAGGVARQLARRMAANRRTTCRPGCPGR